MYLQYFYCSIVKEKGVEYMATTSITIRIDETLKIPNEETLEAIEEVKQMKENSSMGKSYTGVDEMMKELLA